MGERRIRIHGIFQARHYIGVIIMAEHNADIGMKRIKVEAKIFKADGTLKDTETHTTEITNEQYEQLKKDGVIQ